MATKQIGVPHPAGTRLEQLLECALREIADSLLGNAILEVHIYAPKANGELLLCIVTCLF
jgi:hypothetical protein